MRKQDIVLAKDYFNNTEYKDIIEIADTALMYQQMIF